jgi:hypothetical protein
MQAKKANLLIFGPIRCAAVSWPPKRFRQPEFCDTGFLLKIRLQSRLETNCGTLDYEPDLNSIFVDIGAGKSYISMTAS